MEKALNILKSKRAEFQSSEDFYIQVAEKELQKKIAANSAKDMFNARKRVVDELITQIEALPAEERFKKPTDKQLVDFALIFNDGVLDEKQLSNMVGMCSLIVDRLYENGDVTIPTKEEETT